ncbi:MAG: J domain-containing protein [Oligoflexia bacterium]|nr:J domain-containing protein [Oligoflexia bacterium]
MPEQVLDPEISRRYFLLLQIGLGALALLIFWWLHGRREERSAFRLREADRRKTASGAPGPVPTTRDDELARARIARKEPLRITGIRVDGPAHEILGLPPRPTPEQVQRAYRELMKQYHPDRIGRPGSREWQDAQKIAEAINRARDELLAQNRSR